MQDLKDTEEIGLFLAGPLACRVYPTDVERSLAMAVSYVCPFFPVLSLPQRSFL